MKPVPEPTRAAARAGRIVVASLVLLASAVLSSAAEVPRLRLRAANKLSGPNSVVPSGVRLLQTAACVTASIPCDSTVTGTLTADDCVYSLDGTFYDVWTFNGTAGQTVTITMTATFEPFVFLYNPAGRIDSLVPTDEEGQTQLQFSRTLDATGTWTIWANSYNPATGTYSLDLRGCASNPPPPPPPPPTCVADQITHCLNDGRFRVGVIFSAPSVGITNASGRAVRLTSDTGYFWFFSANNVELVVKVVDGRGFNGYFWVFYGALSDVEYTITVTDTLTGAVKTYGNPPGHLASVADTAAFPGAVPATGAATVSAATGPSMADVVRAQSKIVSGLVAASASAACLSDATTLCLNNARFQVRTTFSAPNLGIMNAPARAVPLTSDTGYFWFFSANNIELVIKAVDGRGFNGYFWVFYGALSDVEYTITVTDSLTGAVKTYVNPPGQLASIADVAAF